MQVEHHLPSGALVELLQRHARRPSCPPSRRGRPAARSRWRARGLASARVEEIARRVLRDHQHVAVGARHHVHEGERLLVLVDLSLGSSPRRILAKTFVGS